MGIIKAAAGSVGSVMADQWKEYFYCDSLPETMLMVRGEKRSRGRSVNKGDSDIITNGSVISVADGQCMLIVDNGRIEACCDVPGEYIYDTSTEPTLLMGKLSENIKKTFATMARRFTFGGETARDQRVYYVNTKHLHGNKYGTPSPVPFRVVDRNIGLDLESTVRCFGEYTYHIENAMQFYKFISGNTEGDYPRDRLDGALKADVISGLQPAFGKISAMGIRYSELPGHTTEVEEALNEVLSSKWLELRGMKIVSFNISSIRLPEDVEEMIRKRQMDATLRSTDMAAAVLAGAQADAMRDAAKNENGAMMGFMGMGMANAMGGFKSNELYQMAQAQQAVPPSAAPAPGSWQCSCGTLVSGNFCPQCGRKKPEPKPAGDSWVCPTCGKEAAGKFCPECGTKKPEPKADGWTCPTCGRVNKGKFCPECGSRKPADAPLYRCDKCGWEPEDPRHPPKFCPECGDPFDDGDVR